MRRATVSNHLQNDWQFQYLANQEYKKHNAGKGNIFSAISRFGIVCILTVVVVVCTLESKRFLHHIAAQHSTTNSVHHI